MFCAGEVKTIDVGQHAKLQVEYTLEEGSEPVALDRASLLIDGKEYPIQAIPLEDNPSRRDWVSCQPPHVMKVEKIQAAGGYRVIVASGSIGGDNCRAFRVAKFDIPQESIDNAIAQANQARRFSSLADGYAAFLKKDKDMVPDQSSAEIYCFVQAEPKRCKGETDELGNPYTVCEPVHKEDETACVEALEEPLAEVLERDDCRRPHVLFPGSEPEPAIFDPVRILGTALEALLGDCPQGPRVTITGSS